MLRSLLILAALAAPAAAQSLPSSAPMTSTAEKPARVSLTPDGAWLPNPTKTDEYFAVYNDAGARPRFLRVVDGANLLLYVDRDALQRVALDTVLLQPTADAPPAKTPYRVPGMMLNATTRLQIEGDPTDGKTKVHVITTPPRTEVTGYVPTAAIGTATRWKANNDRPAWKVDAMAPAAFALLGAPKGKPFVVVAGDAPSPVMVLERKAGFALVQIDNGAVGWIAAGKLKKPTGDLNGEEGGVEGGELGCSDCGAPSTLPAKTPLFDAIDGAFVGESLESFRAKPAEKKGTWTRFELKSELGPISVWATTAAPASQNVAPTTIEQNRTAGEKLIVPDDATKTLITRSGKDKIVGSFKLCIDATGRVVEVKILKSTGFPAYDTAIERGMQAWAYKPYMVNGKGAPVCTAATFIYSQK